MNNPFKRKAMEQMQQEKREQASYEMSYGLATSQASAIEDQIIQERKEAMVHLNQWQQNRSPAMQTLFYNLSGCAYDKSTKKIKEVKWNLGYVNIFGARKLVDFIEGLDHNVMLGSWNEKLIILTLRDAIAHPLRRYLFQNHGELDMKLNHAEYIFWMVMNSVEPTYWRGLNDGERRKDKEIIKVQELRNPYFQQKKKGAFGIESP